MVKLERRGAPRADKNVAMKLKLGELDTVIHALNISASGAYCKIDKEIPLMSRVKLVIMLPDMDKPGEPERKIEVTGVVVREHPVVIDGKIKHFDLAIFFEDISQKDREAISGYVSKKAI
jgi:hypothetical protein